MFICSLHLQNKQKNILDITLSLIKCSLLVTKSSSKITDTRTDDNK